MDVRVTGAMIGAAPEVVVQDYIRKDMINVYAFENDKWRSPGSRNGEQMDYQEILCTELLFSSPKDTLLRYTLGKKGKRFSCTGEKMKMCMPFRRFTGESLILLRSLRRSGGNAVSGFWPGTRIRRCIIR